MYEVKMYLHLINTRRPPNAELTLDQRCRQWINLRPALGERLVIGLGIGGWVDISLIKIDIIKYQIPK